MNNFYIILVEPAFPGNIGSVARAMKNMGFGNLRLVNPCDYLCEEAVKLAVNAVDILEKVEVYPNLYEAIKDLNITVASTAKKGKYRKPVYNIENLAPILKAHSEKNKIGLVFGRERIGLLNQEIDTCSLLVEIPSSDQYPCLNLSQSVLLICYEVFKKIKFIQEINISSNVSIEEMETFYKNLEKLLLDIDFLDKENPDFKMRAIRKLFGRTLIEKNELNLLYGIIRQVRNLEYITKKKMEKNCGKEKIV
jgi:TrmH family RNA methyltransferase